LILGVLLLGLLGALAVNKQLCSKPHSRLSLWGVALAFVLGYWLWSAVIVRVSVYCGGYEDAFSRLWFIPGLGYILTLLAATLLAIKHAYKCTWAEARSGVGLFVAVVIAVYFVAQIFLPIVN
jgi:hypothetical protein